MATLIREEGDYTYWDDGAQRYASGNAQGKAPGSLAKRHPQASMPWATNGEGLRKAKDDSANGKIAQRMNKETRRNVSKLALQEALLLHPDSAKEQDGLRLLWEARVEQAGDSEGGSAAVRSHKMIEDTWSGTTQDKQVQTNTQVNITLSPGVGTDLSRFAQLPHIIEGVVIEESEDEE